MWVEPDRLFDGTSLQTEIAVRLEDGCITEVGEGVDSRRVAGTLTPGFVDLQVNGGGGSLVNNDPSADGLAIIANSHRRFGTVAIMPTVITGAPGVMEAAAEAVVATDKPEVIGLHIEGPHISLDKRGTHAADYVRPFEPSTLATVKRVREAGRAVMITVAPEVVSLDEISALAETGAVVSVGHTNADAETVDAAIAAGARCGTHLFNAMSQINAREPGAAGALLSSGTPTGIIADGYHVDMRLVDLAIRSNPNVFLVSDAMATVGGPQSFELYDKTIRLQAGRLVNSEGKLAGAHTTSADGLENLATEGVEDGVALRSVTSVPADVIGRNDLSGLVGRDARDILLLDDRLRVQHALADVIAA